MHLLGASDYPACDSAEAVDDLKNMLNGHAGAPTLSPTLIDVRAQQSMKSEPEVEHCSAEFVFSDDHTAKYTFYYDMENQQVFVHTQPSRS